jgi:hypothetical protein
LEKKAAKMIIFQNPGLIDLRAVSIMGLNAKETKNPIGQFGTGLKYSIAVLLRHNCNVHLYRGEERYIFTSVKEHFRGKEFDFVKMYRDDIVPKSATDLSFTLELGKHWEPWMAIRELESNARDEGGESFANANYQLPTDTTTIVIEGTVAEQAYSQLPNIFISSKPIWGNDTIEIHRAENPEQTHWLHYRGVRCQRLEQPSIYRYNLLREQKLTEDRTFKYSWTGAGEMSALGLCADESAIRAIVTAKKGHFEHEIQFNEYTISDKFVEGVGTLANRANTSAWRAVRIAKGFAEFEELEINALQQQMLERAWTFIEKMGERRVRNFPVFVCADLGPKTLGTAAIARKEIWLSLRVFEMGMKQLISCLFEEYVHLDRGLGDLDYEMQSFLFDTIITQAAKLQGEIL